MVCGWSSRRREECKKKRGEKKGGGSKFFALASKTEIGKGKKNSMALSSRRRAPREAPAAASVEAPDADAAAADSDAAAASKTRKRARVEEAAKANADVVVDAPLAPSTTNVAGAPVAPAAPAALTVVTKREPPPPPPALLDESTTVAFTSTHRDYISARRPGRRLGASAAFAVAAEPLRCSNDEVEEAGAALAALPPKRANAKAQRRAAIEARFPQWREWMR